MAKEPNYLIDDTNYYTVQGWMITKLGLSGNELICFAIIHGFSQDRKSKFGGSLNYLSAFVGCSISTIQRMLDKLSEKGLIIKVTQGKTKSQPSEYISNIRYSNGEISYISETIVKMTIVKMSDDSSQNEHSTIVKMTNNNNINNYSYNNEKKDINSVPSFISKEKEPDAENPQLDKPKKKKKEYTYINPSREEVEAYIKEQGLHITYESMYGYYFNEDKGGWAKKDGTPVLNWKGTCWTFEGHWKERNKDYEDKRKDFSVSAGRVLSPEAERERQRSLEQMRMLKQRRKERERNAVNE